MMDDVFIVDLLERVSSDSSYLLITCSASKIGTFVNKDFKSKLTIMVMDREDYDKRIDSHRQVPSLPIIPSTSHQDRHNQNFDKKK